MSTSMQTFAFVLCWSASEPDRIGENARLLPGEHRIGDVPRTDAPPLVFVAERPGGHDDGAALAAGPGRLSIHAGIFGARIRPLDAPVYVNGKCAPTGQWLELTPGDTVYLRDDVLLIFTLRRPLEPLVHFPRHAIGPFGGPDSLGIVGESAAAWRLREAIAAAAASGEHVLLHGEAGTGKEHAARGVHSLSSRASGFYHGYAMAPSSWDLPFWVYGHAENARGIPEKAFPGLMGELHGGTLFLDHVQLVVSQTGLEALDSILSAGGAYRRVGDPTPRISEFVLVAATNRDPDAVHPLLLKHLKRRLLTPTLAERPEDIPLLVRASIRRDLEKGYPFWNEIPWLDARGQVVPDPRAIERLVRADYRDGNMWDLPRRLGDEAYHASLAARMPPRAAR